jgi:hypothetical protein
MKQYQVKMLGLQLLHQNIRHVHANSIEEAGNKALEIYKGCEVLDVKLMSRRKKK